MPDSPLIVEVNASAPPLSAAVPAAWTPSPSADVSGRLIPPKRASISSRSVHPEPSHSHSTCHSHSHSSKQAQHHVTQAPLLDMDEEPAESITTCCIPWNKWRKHRKPQSEAALIKSLKFSHDDVLVLRANFQELKHIYTTPSDNMFHLDLFVKRFYANFCLIDAKAQELFNGQPSFWLIKHLSGMVFHMIKLIDDPPALLEKVRSVAPQHRGLDITSTSFVSFRHAFVYTTMQSFLLENPFDLTNSHVTAALTCHDFQMSPEEWATNETQQLTNMKRMLQSQIDQYPQDPATSRWRHAIEGAHVWNRLLECTSRVIVFYMGRVTKSEMEGVKEAKKYSH